MVESSRLLFVGVFPGDLAVIVFGRRRGSFWTEVEGADGRKVVSEDGSKVMLYLAVFDCFASSGEQKTFSGRVRFFVLDASRVAIAGGRTCTRSYVASKFINRPAASKLAAVKR
jgi:hypothetical protein